jgi:hypothetical protein
MSATPAAATATAKAENKATATEFVEDDDEFEEFETGTALP